MLDCTESDLVDETIWKYTHPEDVEESRRLFDRLREKGKPFHLEERLIRKDGSVLWVNISASPILDEVDKPQSAVFIVVDLTERKRAEEALQKLNLELESPESEHEPRNCSLRTGHYLKAVGGYRSCPSGWLMFRRRSGVPLPRSFTTALDRH